MAVRRSAFVSWATAVAVLLTGACLRQPAAGSPNIRLVQPSEPGGIASIDVTQPERGVVRAASRLDTGGAWPRVLSVHVVRKDGTVDDTAIAGRYEATGDALRFTPLFPFDPGRTYEVRYDASTLVADAAIGRRRVTVVIPVAAAGPATVVTDLFPSGELVPANQLRMYITFSAPMGRRGGLAHVRLLDDRGVVVVDPFLQLDADLWNRDRTRYTLLFDPGRQKRGILPNREMGPSLVEGRRYTVVVEREWIDGEGRPLGEPFRRTFRVGPPDRLPIDPARWLIEPPAAGTRQPLTLDFGEPLDRELAARSIGVRCDGRSVDGEVRIEAHEQRWQLVPNGAWRPCRYEIVALSMLEDLAGNRIGRAFEVAPAGASTRDDESPFIREFALAPPLP